MNWQHLIEAAKMLAGSHETFPTPPGRPRQAMLRRAVSTAYYAMFHALCESNADTLVGQSSPSPHSDLWVETYRALQHRTAKNRLASYIRLTQDPALRNFGQVFGAMQQQRISADYNPRARFARSEVVTSIGPVRSGNTRLLQRSRSDTQTIGYILASAKRPQLIRASTRSV